MSDIAVRVDSVSKLYHIGKLQRRHDTLRDALVDAVKTPRTWRRDRSSARHARGDSASSGPNSGEGDDHLWALRDISFDVHRGEVIGIIGRNGAGKSTLLKILSRITEPTEGRAEIHGRVGSLLEVGTGFHPELTGRENIYLNGAILGMHRAEIARNFDEIVAFAEIEKFLDTPVKRYSSGMYVRLAFAVAAHLEPEILLVDEVLAVGDAAFQKKCLGKMGDVAKQGRTVLFVSHNMTAIAHLTRRSLLLHQGRLMLFAETLQVLSEYQGAAAHDGAMLRVESRQGVGPIRFTSFGWEAEGEHLLSGQPARLVVGYTTSPYQACRNIEVSISILDAGGARITNLSNFYFSGAPYEEVPPSGHFVCYLPRFPLRAGTYTVDLYCGVGPLVSDYLLAASAFTAVDGDYYGTGMLTRGSPGSVFLDHAWELRSASLHR